MFYDSQRFRECTADKPQDEKGQVEKQHGAAVNIFLLCPEGGGVPSTCPLSCPLYAKSNNLQSRTNFVGLHACSDSKTHVHAYARTNFAAHRAVRPGKFQNGQHVVVVLISRGE